MKKLYFVFFDVIFSLEALAWINTDDPTGECYLPQDVSCSKNEMCSPDTSSIFEKSSITCENASPNLGSFVGPAYAEITVCQCEITSVGPFCKIPEGQAHNCNDHCNGGKIYFVTNTVTGCDCKGTGHWGWYCERENKDLCKYVDKSNYIVNFFYLLPVNFTFD